MPLKTHVIMLCKVYHGKCTHGWHHNGQPMDMHTSRSGLMPTFLLSCGICSDMCLLIGHVWLAEL